MGETCLKCCPCVIDCLMRVTWKTLLTAFVIAVPCSALIFHSSNWPLRVLGESGVLTLVLAFPVAGGIAVCRWAANGQSAKERVGRAFKLFLVVVSLLVLIGVVAGAGGG
jgi:hypothetical protein